MDNQALDDETIYIQENPQELPPNIYEDEQSRDDVTIFIQEKLRELPPMVPECSIYRVPKQLLNMNHKAYMPQVISIGPFHHDQQVFKATEELKLRFFNSYQCRIKMDIQGIIDMARSWEERARNHYSDPINMSSDDFIKMMLLDGCFVVEFMIVGCQTFDPTENTVNSSCYQAITSDICCDLIMLENQLPFFVLESLFDIASPTDENRISFEEVVHVFLLMRVLLFEVAYKKSDQKPHHLVDFLSFYFVPLANENENYELQLRCPPPNATKLSEAGVVFKKAETEEEYGHIMDISFKDGVLKIPPFPIYDNFETYVRNLMAFEQFPVVYSEEKNEELHSKKIVTQYFEFLDELINTEKDASLLAKAGIITNNIGGSDKEISELFNGLCKNLTIDCYDSYLNNVGKDLNKHCETRWNSWMASLKHNYFNTPWAFISFLAATFLIVLTLLQTIFSAISISK